VGDVKVFEVSFVDEKTPKSQESAIYTDAITVDDQVQQIVDADLRGCAVRGPVQARLMKPRILDAALDPAGGGCRRRPNQQAASPE
jgi:hypothetical protein